MRGKVIQEIKKTEFSSEEIQVLTEDSLKIGDIVYTVNGDIKDKAYISTLSSAVNTAAFSPDGSTLVLGGLFTGYAKRYTVSGTSITYTSDIYANAGTTALNSSVSTAAFSPDGSTLVLGGNFTGKAKRYTVSGTNITYTSNIYSDAGTTVLSGIVNTAIFSPDGNTLVLGGSFTEKAKRYTVSGTNITYTSDIYADAGTTILSDSVSTAAFSPDGNTLILGGLFTGYAKRYAVSGTNVTYTSDIYANAGTTALSSSVSTAAFSPDGSILVLGGNFTGKAKRYTVSGTSITYASDIYADAGTAALSNAVWTAAFSPDGNTLVLGGNFTGYAKRYTVSGASITYTSDIYADAVTTALGNITSAAAFSPDGNTLVLGGNFTGRAKRYTVSGTSITYTSDIYADAGTTALDDKVNSAAFSPDGNTLVLGGRFTGRAKRYTVSGTSITYTSDIYADAGTTALNDVVYAVAFSPDGNTLVIGGGFTGRAKRYTVSGTNITYTSDIYSDAGTTALSGPTYAVAFSPNGNILVLCGVFKGGAKRYTVSGTSITYTSDIYSDAGTTALGSNVSTVAFSPDGSILVLGGNFTGKAKRYTVSGTNVTYTSDIYSDAGTTALSSAAYAAAFSPDGNTLVLGGIFTGYAKRYTVSGTNIIYTSDIYSDAGTTALIGQVNAAAFSPDGNTLILGGDFSRYAKRYTVSGTSIAYTSDIYANTGTTALSNVAAAAAFSPDGSTLVLGGLFTGRAKRYAVSGTNVKFLNFVKKLNSTFAPMFFDYFGYTTKNASAGQLADITIFTDSKQN